MKNDRAAGPLFRREGIKRNVRIALPRCRVLHHQGHDSSKGWSSGRGAADDIERAFLINQVAIVARGSKRNVRHITLAVGGNSRSRLPERLGINRAHTAAA